MAVPPGQELNKKDDANLKQVMKLFESKQHKKALKLVQGILDKNPQHGESLAMKGLIISSAPYNKKDEAYDLVKEGISKNFKSLVCWHVYGLLYRADNNYNEAIKCYKQALRIDGSNLSILKDLAMLQIHSGEISSLADTRLKLLQLKPHIKANWISFALAHHLQGNHACAIAILDAYEQACGLPTTKYEISEALLYRVQIMLESKDWEKTLEMIDQYGEKLRDKESVLCTQGECYEMLNKKDKAVECYAELVDRNIEQDSYVEEYVKVRADAESIAPRVIYKELAAKYPKSQTIEKFYADCTEGEEFRGIITQLIKRYLLKCIPSLMLAMKSFYVDEKKIKIVEEVLNAFDVEYETSKTVGGEPACLVLRFWIWVAQCGHYYRAGAYEKALEYVEKALKHTPTIEMIYVLKARVLKKLGRVSEAVPQLETAAKMDMADRYLTNKLSKYLLRNGEWKRAETNYNTFTYRPQQETWWNIIDMQNMGYETELGDCLYRQGDVENALQVYLLVERHFQDVVEDSFDFHHYATKRTAIRSYLEMLRFMKTARNHRHYWNAAPKIIRCYLDIHRDGKEAIEARKLKEYAEHHESRYKQVAKELKEKELELKAPINFDAPLAAAEPFLTELLKYRSQHLPTQLLAVEYYTIKDQAVIALRNIKQALTLDGAKASTELKALAVKFFEAQKPKELHAAVKELLATEEKAVLAAFTC